MESQSSFLLPPICLSTDASSNWAKDGEDWRKAAESRTCRGRHRWTIASLESGEGWVSDIPSRGVPYCVRIYFRPDLKRI